MRTFIIDESDVGADLDEAIRITLTLSYPDKTQYFSKIRQWRGNRPLFNAIVQDNEIACGYLAVVDRTIRVGEKPVRVAAVGMVAVAPALPVLPVLPVERTCASREPSRYTVTPLHRSW